MPFCDNTAYFGQETVNIRLSAANNHGATTDSNERATMVKSQNGLSQNGLAIDLRNVTKTYRRRVHALRGVAMQVHPGEVFGLLGPNGAGKSTLVKIMMTVIRPSRAEGTVLGHAVGHKPTLGRVGYLPENHRFPGYLTGRQVLECYAALAKVDRPTRKRRSLELLEMVGMREWANAKLATYSKGMQQRIGLAQALMNDPDLIVLDEPTDGLDPMGRRETRQTLQQLRDQGKTVFLNSHLLGEVERVCDRVAILAAGNVVRQGTLAELTAGTEHYEIEIHNDGSPGLGNLIREALPCPLEISATPIIETPSAQVGPAPPPPIELGKLPTGETVELEGTGIRIGTGDPALMQPIIDALRQRDLTIRSIGVVRQSLEDYFIQAVAGATATGATATGPAALPIAKGGRP